MPVNTNFGTLSIGRDVSIDVILPGGVVLTIANITSFDAKPKQKKLESPGIDGIHRTATLPQSWALTFDVDRQDRALDDFFAQIEADYFAGKTVQNCTITETITEPDQTLSQYRYEGCSLHFEDAGAWKADSFVKMRLGAEASRRKRIQ